MGRSRELNALSHALDHALAGRLSIAVLAGEGGIGKTRLAQEWGAQTQHRGVPLLWGTCYEGERPPPFGPWASALRGHIRSSDASELVDHMGNGAAEIAELVPDLRELLPGLETPVRLPPAGARLRLFDCLANFLTRVSRRNGLLVVLDNLQWADTSSLQFLEHLVVELRGERVLLLGTYRPAELDPDHPLERTLGELVKHPLFLRLHLEGLTRKDVAHFLAVALGRDATADLSERIYRKTAGNPLFLVEYVRQIKYEPQADEGEPSVPDGIRQALGRRLGGLPKDCYEVLSIAALMGRSFEQGVLLRSIPEMDQRRILENLDLSVASGFLRELSGQPGRLEFSHALIQETLLETISAARRRRGHAGIAVAMEETIGKNSPERSRDVVRHLAAAVVEVGIDRLLTCTVSAAKYALDNYAPDEALAQIDQALSICQGWRQTSDSTKALTAALLHLKGRALDGMGDDHAAESVTRAFDLYQELGDTDRAIEVALTPVWSSVRIGLFQSRVWDNRGLQSLRGRALEMVDRGSVEEGWLLCQENSLESLESALDIAVRAEEKRLEMWVLARLACRHVFQGAVRQGMEENRRAIEIAERLQDHYALDYGLHWRSVWHLLTGDLDAAWDCIQQLLSLGARVGSRAIRVRASHIATDWAYARGDWEACRRHAREALSLQTGRESIHPFIDAHTELAMADFETGHFQEGERHLHDLTELSGVADAPAPFVAAKIARITGDSSRLAAADLVAQRVRENPERPFAWWQMVRQTAVALSAVAREDAEAAAASLDYFQSKDGYYLPTDAGGKSSDGVAALLCAVLGRLDEAVNHFEKALAFCRRGYRGELAWTCADYGEALIRRDSQGDFRLARSLLEEGLATANELDMVPLVRRMENIRQSAGPRRTDNPAGLTEREVGVLRLVARGFTNQEIGERLHISPLTAARHVHNILTKTGMANRAEVTAFSMREGLVEE